MSAKTLMLAHGEKLAVLLTAGACGLILFETLSDVSIRPSLTTEKIEDINKVIGDRLVKQNPPVMKEPRPYLDDLKARVAQSIPLVPAMAWMTAPPDVSKDPGGGTGVFLYAYEILTPTVELKDNVGTLTLHVTLPEVPATENEGRRIGSALNRTWNRMERGRITNHAQVVGVQLRVRVGEGEWRPLVLPGASADGVLPLPLKDQLVLTNPESWQRHEVQARLVVSATGLDLSKPVDKGARKTVLVFSGKTVASSQEDERFLGELTAQLTQPGELAKRVLAPVAPPAGVRIPADELAYLGAWGPSGAAIATSSVRFALLKFTVEPDKDDPTKSHDVAKFAFTRRFEENGVTKWLDKPAELTYGIGDQIGVSDTEQTVPNPFNPKEKRKANFETPFRVEKMVKDQRRVLFWSVREKSRTGGGKGRELDVEKKEVGTEIVILKNPDTGTEITLTKLMPIPQAKPNTWVYPFRLGIVDEREQFLKDPAGFRQWGLVPEQPKEFQAGTGPLEELRAADPSKADTYETDTTYVQFADGRLLWWEKLNGKTRLHDPNGVEKAKVAAPPQPQAEPAPPQGNKPKHAAPAGSPNPQPNGAAPAGMPPMDGGAPPVQNLPPR